MLESLMHTPLAWPCAVVLTLVCMQACTNRGDPLSQRAGCGAAAAATARTNDAMANDRTTADASSTANDPQPVAAGSRTFLAGVVENARDLGGIQLRPGHRVRAGLLFRGPPLASLSSSGCAALAQYQLRSVIDLRIESESALQPDAACALDNAQLVAAPLPVPYNVSPQDYIADLDATESIARVFQVLADEQRYPVYFHCTWGRDRTGVVAALILLALGAGRDAIVQDYLISRDTVGAFPMSLTAALDEIERRGGVEAYLDAAGVTKQQLSVLRAQATD